MVQVLEGLLTPPKGARFVLVVSRFNDFIVEHLRAGAIDTLKRHGVDEKNIVTVRVPGAWEIPLACSAVAKKHKPSAII
ncbi:MAG: 6,7-dimethyl-8-ribityllumazine synthase, partial [Polyangiaceae bacterium]|nr:6,7-dimethyl-8-ribityllumazine synthase [Polyangiaceae bacterium]